MIGILALQIFFCIAFLFKGAKSYYNPIAYKDIKNIKRAYPYSLFLENREDYEELWKNIQLMNGKYTCLSTLFSIICSIIEIIICIYLNSIGIKVNVFILFCIYMVVVLLPLYYAEYKVNSFIKVYKQNNIDE